jgi:peptidylprolyl isomerase
MLGTPSQTRRTTVSRAHAAIAALLATAVLIAGCGSDDSPATKTANTSPLTACEAGTLDDVTVTGDPGAEPKVELDGEVSVERTACALLIPGTGDPAADGDAVIFDFVFINGRTGDKYGTTYTVTDEATGTEKPGEAASVILNDKLKRGVRQGLLGSKTGSRVAVAIAPDDLYGLEGGDPDNGLEKDDTLVFVADIKEVRHPLQRAEGTAVAPVAGLPTVTLGDKGKPSIVVPSTEPPTTLVIQPLIQGTGATVTTGQTITVHYTGVLWKTGQQFDSSWDRGSTTNFPIGTGGVIAGWDKGLVGQKVGSQILLVVPPADGYGEAGAPNAGIGATDTLVFVVDILDAR